MAISLAGLGHHRTTPGPGGGPNETAVHAAARLTLSQLVLPPGAVRSGLVPGTPAELWSPGGVLSVPNRVDVYGVWRLPGGPQSVFRFLEAHPPAGSHPGFGSTEGGGSGSHSVIDMATEVFDFPGNSATVIWRELAVKVVALRGGGSALRADGQAGSVIPRSPEERIPAGATAVRATTSNPNARGRRAQRTILVKSPARLQSLVALLNALPLSHANARCSLGKDPGYRLRLAFDSGARATPLAVAVYNPNCNRIQLVIAGRAQPDLSVGFPDPLADISDLQELESFAVKLR